jgi:hypothetical protein
MYFTQGQRDMIYRELNQYFNEYSAFGNPDIDSEHWERLMHYMNKDNRYLVQVKYKEDGEAIEDAEICFKHKDVYCSVGKYAESPYHSWHIVPEYITNVREIISDEQLLKN